MKAKRTKITHFPRTLGYSSAGIVEKTGAGVRSVKPGDFSSIYEGIKTELSKIK